MQAADTTHCARAAGEPDRDVGAIVRNRRVVGHVYAVTQGPDRRVGDGLIGALGDAGLAPRQRRCTQW